MKKFNEEPYSRQNVHLERWDVDAESGVERDMLTVTLTYPPYKPEHNVEGKIRYVEFNQESVRASDGVRLHYDFERDGIVVEQPKPIIKGIAPLEGTKCGVGIDTAEVWIEVGFFQSWALNPNSCDFPSEADIAAFEAAQLDKNTAEDKAQ